MKELYRSMMKREAAAFALIAAELAAVYILLNLSASCIILSAEAFGGERNDDAVTLFSYIAVAAVALYAFTVSLQYVRNYGKNEGYYRVLTLLGATKDVIVSVRLACLASVYGAALVAGAATVTGLDIRYLSEDGIRFFTFTGQGVAFVVYTMMFAVNAATDAVFVKRLKTAEEE